MCDVDRDTSSMGVMGRCRVWYASFCCGYGNDLRPDYQTRSLLPSPFTIPTWARRFPIEQKETRGTTRACTDFGESQSQYFCVISAVDI